MQPNEEQINEIINHLPDRKFYDFEETKLGNDLKQQFKSFISRNSDLEVLKLAETLHLRTPNFSEHEAAALKLATKKWLASPLVNELGYPYPGSPHEKWVDETGGLKVFLNNELVRAN